LTAVAAVATSRKSPRPSSMTIHRLNVKINGVAIEYANGDYDAVMRKVEPRCKGLKLSSKDFTILHNLSHIPFSFLKMANAWSQWIFSRWDTLLITVAKLVLIGSRLLLMCDFFSSRYLFV